MKNFFRDLAIQLIKALNALLMTAAFTAVWLLFYQQSTGTTATIETIIVSLLFLVIYVMFGRTYEAFHLSIHRIREVVLSQALSVVMADVLLFAVVWLIRREFPAILPMVAVGAVQGLIALVWSYMGTKWYFGMYPAKKTVVIYDVRQGVEGLIKEYGMRRKFRLTGVISVEDCLKNNLAALEGAEATFLCGVHSHDRNIILKYCVEHDIVVYVIPRVGDVIMSGAKKIHILHLPMLRVGRYNPPPEYKIIKRLFDIVASGLVLLVASPVMLITAIAIKATDGGPVFYKQCRLTKDGRKFNVLKFRSMRVDAEKDGVARLSSGDNDDRITPVGRFIRKVRIDELPQLLNILQGSMSVVGPRPERPEIAAQYEEEMPEFRLRLQAKAGLTGYAQVYGKYNTTPYDKLQMDLMYIAKPSFVEDLRIIFSTIKILFKADSTEGVQEGQITASDRPAEE